MQGDRLRVVLVGETGWDGQKVRKGALTGPERGIEIEGFSNEKRNRKKRNKNEPKNQPKEQVNNLVFITWVMNVLSSVSPGLIFSILRSDRSAGL